MTCSTFRNFKGCGKCKFDIYDNRIITSLNALQITRLGAKLVYNFNLTHSTYEADAIDNIKVTCTGDITFNTANNSNTISYYEIKSIYHKLLTFWYHNNVIIRDNASTARVKDVLNNFNEITTSIKLMSMSIRLAKAMM